MAEEKEGSLKSEMAKTALRVFREEVQEKVGKTVRAVREFAEETAEQVIHRTESESAFVRFSLRTRTQYDRFMRQGMKHMEAYIRACEEMIEELCKEERKPQ